VTRPLHPIARYVPLLIAGDEEGLRALFAGAPRVNDPRLGWVDEARFGEFVSNSHRGLAERNASVAHVSTTVTDSGAVEECLVNFVRLGSEVSLPVAVASDMSVDSLLGSIRIYHSMWPVAGFHLFRSPVLPILAAAVLPDVVERYHDCLARADVRGILAQFAPTGEVRESTSPEARHRGAAALGRFFDVLFAGGGLAVEHCAVSDDGTSCALESVVTSTDSVLLPQAAASVFERAPTGLLAAVRMYDDIDHPYN
jgi:hypothetical protein